MGDSKTRHKSRANVAQWAQQHRASIKQTDKNAQSVKPTSA
jgi:hypothetical protein